MDEKSLHRKRQDKKDRRKLRIAKAEAKKALMLKKIEHVAVRATPGFSRHAWNNTMLANSAKPVLKRQLSFDKQAWRDE
jgi:hypothetical protein